MHYILGFIIWTVIGLVAGGLVRAFYRVADTDLWLSLTFGFFGAFIGGMLGTSGYIHHDPSPVRFGSLLGATIGALFIVGVYHFTTDKVV
jgi:uncharacterized membrane protein YeaQ/YmgE (transglycosylase-associated protein family)